jgi:Undecaprenyl-phosphate glucose phosphotransferase
LSEIGIQYIFLTLAISVLWYLIASMFNCYDAQRSKPLSYDLQQLVKVQLLLFGIISLPLFYLHTFFSRHYIILLFSFSFCAFFVLRISLRCVLRYMRQHGYNARRLMIIGGGIQAKKVFDKVSEHPEFGYKQPVVLADTVTENGLLPFHKGAIADLRNIISSFDIDDVIVAYPLSREKEMIDIVAKCEAEGVRVRVALDFFQLVHNRIVMEEIGELPLIGLRPEPLIALSNRLLKRTFDIVFSLIVLLVLSPLFMLIALLIKLSSPGPVLFKQQRIGANNKSFDLYKFRTMRVQASKDSDTIWTKRNDDRVTSVGRIMRKLNLDELPQFYNVLIGEMSVVGPRPEREFFVDKFAEQIRAYRVRHLVRVGITGWAQIHGLRGDTSIADRVEYDLYYLENWTFWMDIKIIIKTVLGKNKNAM